MEMRGRREIYERGREERGEETEESLIYISCNKAGEEKVLFAKIIASVPHTIVGYCPACHRKTNLKGWNGIYECLACGMVRSEEEIIKESIKRWWL